jgi:hypothetical protein
MRRHVIVKKHLDEDAVKDAYRWHDFSGILQIVERLALMFPRDAVLTELSKKIVESHL